VSGYLYWVDIPQKTLYSLCLKNQTTTTYTMPEQIGFVVLDKPGYLIGGLESGLARITLSTGQLTFLGRPDDMPANSRFNDGKQDRQGRIWTSTMDLTARNKEGALYSYRFEDGFQKHDTGFTIGNGPTWSTDYTTFYHTETRRSTIFAYDFDESTGVISHKREFYQHKEDGVRPDGMCTDDENHLWVALAHGGRLLRLTPTGKIERESDVNTSFPTSCAMGKNKILYITTSRQVSPPNEKLNAWSGSLLSLNLNSI
jgi:sugar lactone lactonase YvrE